MPFDYDLIVIGSGAAGSVGAHYAVNLGKRVAVVERDQIGGECPNYGCVPTKSLLHAANLYDEMLRSEEFGIKARDIHLDYRRIRDWKNTAVGRTGTTHGAASLKEDGIDVLRGNARFITNHEIVLGTRHYTADKFLIATGSDVFVPPIPGLAGSGYITFRDAINFDTLPESIFIMGGGAIGCEFAQLFSSFGVKNVIIADTTPRLLARHDSDVSALVQTLFMDRGIMVMTNTTVKRVYRHDGKVTVYFDMDDKEHQVTVEEFLVAAGKRPAVEHLELERIGVAVDRQGVRANDLMQTTVPNIYTAGDVAGPYMFTHTASYQGMLAAKNMFGRKKERADYSVIPTCVFLTPEVAMVGVTEDELKEKKLKYKKGIAPIAVLGRANTSNNFNGFCKILANSRGEILGASLVSPRAGEVMHEIALAMKLGATIYDIQSLVHTYPTFSQIVKLACDMVE